MNWNRRAGVLLAALIAFSSRDRAATLPPTAIEQRIASARQAIAQDGTPHPERYGDLVAALVRRARETADRKFCDEADRAMERWNKSGAIRFENRRARVTVRLCQERWADALEEATALTKLGPDDIMVWGYIADANVGLGHYGEAETATQRMIDMRQVNPQALQRGARLRELFGYPDPAIEWWTSSLRLTSPTDGEERAWLLTQIARAHRTLGRSDAAQAALKQAFAEMPGYPWALDEQVRVADPMALPREYGPDETTLASVLRCAREGGKSAEAVRIAEDALRSRQPIELLHAYALALAASGEYARAEEQIAKALHPGFKGPEWFVTAGEIAQKAGHPESAKKYFGQAIEAAPSSPVAAKAIEAMSRKRTEASQN